MYYIEPTAPRAWIAPTNAGERGDRKGERTRAEAALAIFTELKMPREIDGVKKLIERIGGGE
jgi:hypothetical protein